MGGERQFGEARSTSGLRPRNEGFQPICHSSPVVPKCVAFVTAMIDFPRRWVPVRFQFRDLWISLDYPLCPDGRGRFLLHREASFGGWSFY